MQHDSQSPIFQMLAQAQQQHQQHGGHVFVGKQLSVNDNVFSEEDILAAASMNNNQQAHHHGHHQHNQHKEEFQHFSCAHAMQHLNSCT